MSHDLRSHFNNRSLFQRKSAARPWWQWAAGAVAVLAVLYAAVWFYAAFSLKRQVEEALAALPQDKASLQFASLEVSGFPGDITLTLQDPSLHLFMNALLPVTVLPETEKTHLQFTWSLTGALRFRTNLLASHMQLETEGESRSAVNAGGQEMVMQSHAEGANNCDLHMQPQLSSLFRPWFFSAPVDSADVEAMWLSRFRQISCTIPATKATRAEDGELMMQTETPVAFAVSTQPSRDTFDFALNVSVKDLVFGPASDAYVNMLEPFMVSRAINTPVENALRVPMSKLGKHTVEVSMHATFPNGEQQVAPSPMAPFSVVIDRFDAKTDLWNFSSQLQLQNVVADNDATLTLKGGFKVHVDPAYDTLLKEHMEHAAAAWLAAPLELPADNPFVKFNNPATWEAVKAVTPYTSTLGDMVMNVDLQSNLTEAGGMLHIADFLLSSTPYGVKLSGALEASKQPMGVGPSTDVKLECRECVALLRDGAAYAAHVGYLLSIMSDAPAWPVDPRWAEQTGAFLVALAPPEKDEATGQAVQRFVLTAPESKPQVNGKPVEAVAQLYQQHVTAPVLSVSPAAPQ